MYPLPSKATLWEDARGSVKASRVGLGGVPRLISIRTSTSLLVGRFTLEASEGARMRESPMVMFFFICVGLSLSTLSCGHSVCESCLFTGMEQDVICPVGCGLHKLENVFPDETKRVRRNVYRVHYG